MKENLFRESEKIVTPFFQTVRPVSPCLGSPFLLCPYIVLPVLVLSSLVHWSPPPPPPHVYVFISPESWSVVKHLSMCSCVSYVCGSLKPFFVKFLVSFVPGSPCIVTQIYINYFLQGSKVRHLEECLSCSLLYNESGMH